MDNRITKEKAGGLGTHQSRRASAYLKRLISELEQSQVTESPAQSHKVSDSQDPNKKASAKNCQVWTKKAYDWNTKQMRSSKRQKKAIEYILSIVQQLSRKGQITVCPVYSEQRTEN